MAEIKIIAVGEEEEDQAEAVEAGQPSAVRLAHREMVPTSSKARQLFNQYLLL
jgi:hypothetical protein